MNKALVVITALLAVVLGGMSQAQACVSYQIVNGSASVEYDAANGLRRSQVTLQVGQNALNRFIVHRVVKAGSGPMHLPIPAIGPVVLLPGGGSRFDIYGIGGPGASIRDKLALAGYDVFGYTPRTAQLEPGYCEVNDCSAAVDWGMQTYLDDAEIVATIARAANFGKKPVVGGVSLGAMLSIGAVNRHPGIYSGAILIEGTMDLGVPELEPAYDALCEYYDDLLVSGSYLDNFNNPILQSIISGAVNDPNGVSDLAPPMTNLEFAVYFSTMPQSLDTGGEVPDYTYLAGDLYNGWTFASLALLGQFADQVIYYDPTALTRDYKCAFAGDNTYTSNLGAFVKPVLSMQAGLGFGDYAEGTLALMTQAAITRNVREDFGHMDWVVGESYQDSTITPILTWLGQIQWW